VTRVRLLIVLVVTAALYAAGVYAIYDQFRSGLIRTYENANETLARTFGNTRWVAIREVVQESANLPTNELRFGPRHGQIDGVIREFVRDTPVLKVKIYSLAGRTIYSSENRQIGEDKQQNQGFQMARLGTPVSDMYWRGSFSTFENEVADRNLVATYVPVRGADGRIAAVFEVYVDSLPMVQVMNRAVLILALVLAAMLAALFGLWLYASRKSSA